MGRKDLIFRVFVSSTFNDFVEERNALQAKNGPFARLRKYCQERGARFQAIDLRWGVSQEASLDHQTMRICQEELRRCQELSPRPNFLVLLGNRYGWRPLPARIDSREFQMLLRSIPAAKRDLFTTDDDVPAWRDGARIARRGWYREDLNAAPPEYVLQPRTIDWPANLSREEQVRIRRDEARDWGAIETEMRARLVAAADASGWSVDDPRRFKFEASATHQEIHAGAMRADRPADHVLAYFREIDGLPADAEAHRFRDLVSGAADVEAETRLSQLKGELTRLLPPGHVHTYRATWNQGTLGDSKGAMCDAVERDLKALIARELTVFRGKSGYERERDAHWAFAEDRRKHFVGRSDLLRRIREYIDSDDRIPLVLHGRSGSGKTALLAEAALGVAASPLAVDGLRVVCRFIGATPDSCDLRRLLEDLGREFGDMTVASDVSDLVRAFVEHLSAEETDAKEEDGTLAETRSTPKVVIFLDALDQLNRTDGARMLHWLPRRLKASVKLVVSTLDDASPPAQDRDEPAGRRIDDDENPIDVARRRWPDGLVHVGELDPESADRLLMAWLTDEGRTLRAEQKAHVMESYAECPLPLYLKLAFAEIRRWASWETIPTPLGADVDGLLAQTLGRLERPENHGAVIPRCALAYVTASRSGLTEDEMLDLLSLDERVLAEFRERSPESPAIDGLPVIVWSRLAADLRPFLVTRRADGTQVMGFYHSRVAAAVRSRCLPTDATRVDVHSRLADYFDRLDLWAETVEAQRVRATRLSATPRPVNVRKVVELPYHRLEVAKLAGRNDPISPLWDAVAQLMTDWEFLEAKAAADPNFRGQPSSDDAAEERGKPPT